MSDMNNERLSFEQAMIKLEEALKMLNQGDISLDEAVSQYKTGLDMANYCQKLLQTAEGEIKILQDGLERDFQVGE